MKFTTSVNIERDVNSEFNYIVTPNSKVIKVLQQKIK
jgi:hypothetical protein